MRNLLFILTLPLFLCNSLRGEQSELDSLINAAMHESDDSVLLSIYNDIGSASYRIDQQLAKKYWNKALKLGEKRIKSERSTYNIDQLANATNGLGIIHRRMGDYSVALTYYQRCLKLNEEMNSEGNKGYTLQNIGIIYRDLQEFDKAIEYYNKSLAIRKKVGDTLGLASTYNAFGILYRRMKQYDMALKYYKESLEISAKMKDDENVAQSYNNIGVVYVIAENYPKAIEFFNKGYELHSSKNNEAGMARYHANMGGLYRRMGNLNKSIEEGLKAYELYDKMGRKKDKYEVALQLSQAYVKVKQYRNGLKYYKNYIFLRDSVFNEESMREIAQKELQFEFDKKMMADSLARAEAQKIQQIQYEQEINQQKTVTYGGAIILIIVILFSALIYKRLKISNKQKEIIEEQKLIVEAKNKEIVDSINYAKRIQSAILPSIDKIQEKLPHSFVLYQPKDIVAGDFYWYKEREGKILMAVADCTGHGVPGAMVSVVCNNALNRSVNDFKLTEPAKILDKTAELVIEAFEKNHEEVKDGMDICLCSFDLENKQLEYAGAINSLFYITENKLTEIKGDKQPIGQFAHMKPFTNHKLSLSEGDKIYMFSDGYADQFGGKKGKKYMYKRFRELIVKVSALDFSKQGDWLKTEFEQWRGDLEQLDDVCVIGVKV